MNTRRAPGTREHRWIDLGSDAAVYCDDCKQPTNSARHITRAGHHLYVCADCAVRRLSAPAIRLIQKGGEETGD